MTRKQKPQEGGNVYWYVVGRDKGKRKWRTMLDALAVGGHLFRSQKSANDRADRWREQFPSMEFEVRQSQWHTLPQ